ncbi:unnamed protein product [Mycena citricolor]|uniref:Uncharacterized protein n=1 Tax=Mycena citricolor TaxID=2018698 RepID=A0AAD2H8M1_9AGAR|nr:unnamed protein product [Mycena citricolor]
MKALDGRGIGFDMDMFRAERTQSAGHCGDGPRAGPCAWTQLHCCTKSAGTGRTWALSDKARHITWCC